MADDPSLWSVGLGFVGGLVGGLLVNVASFHYQKRVERRLASADALHDYKANLIGRLNEILTFWNTESSGSRPSFKPIQNKFEIFARQIAKDISNPPAPLRPEISTEFEELIVALNQVRDFITGLNRSDDFQRTCQTAIEKVERIKALDTEWFESG